MAETGMVLHLLLIGHNLMDFTVWAGKVTEVPQTVPPCHRLGFVMMGRGALTTTTTTTTTNILLILCHICR